MRWFLQHHSGEEADSSLSKLREAGGAGAGLPRRRLLLLPGSGPHVHRSTFELLQLQPGRRAGLSLSVAAQDSGHRLLAVQPVAFVQGVGFLTSNTPPSRPSLVYSGTRGEGFLFLEHLGWASPSF